jgi:hypothetical protein
MRINEQDVWDEIAESTPFLPYKIDLENPVDLAELENHPHMKAMMRFVFYEGDSPCYKKQQRRRAADLVMIAAAIMNAVTGPAD